MIVPITFKIQLVVNPHPMHPLDMPIVHGIHIGKFFCADLKLIELLIIKLASCRSLKFYLLMLGKMYYVSEKRILFSACQSTLFTVHLYPRIIV
jgi:hypothetical protein